MKTHFELHTGGYPGPYFHITIKDAVLHCTRDDGNGWVQKLVVPVANREEWVQLSDYCATRKWKASYDQEEVLDGTHWQLEFRRGAVHLRSQGSNSYPPGYRKILALVNKLLEAEGIFVY